MEGWYYLHTNGELIYKRDLDGTAADIRESSFARALWPMDPSNRDGAWTILVEAMAAGANKKRVEELAAKWHCDDADAQTYADFVGAKLSHDGNSWCATAPGFLNIQESPVGFGETALDALADLCKDLGYRPNKMWGNSFRDLLSAQRITAMFVIVPNALRDALHRAIDKALAGRPCSDDGREALYEQLLAYYSEQGAIPEFDLTESPAQ